MKISIGMLAIISIGSAVVCAQETPVPTPAMSTPTPSCWDVSVEGDATFCIEGPICSGSGAEPVGRNCPKIGDVAKADCWDYVQSYAGAEGCVAPVDALCEMLKTGAWGCVWNIGGGSMEDGSAGSSSASGSGSGAITFPVNASSEAENPEDIQFPASNLKATTFAAEGSSSSDSGSTGLVVGVVAAIAGIVCAVAAATYLRRKHQRREEVAEFAKAIETPVNDNGTHAYAGRTPLTPPLRDERGFFSKTTV